MKQTTMEPVDALDCIVNNWIQRFENVHFRVRATHHQDKDTGDEFITVYDPRTDACLTVFLTPSWYGNDVVKLARGILSSGIKR